jgi:hypothetical protein
LRVLSTSGSPWFSQHGNRVRNPHRQRVAIKRHEFLEQSTVASAITSGVANRSAVQPTVLSSLLAPVRGATACSAVAVAKREPRGRRVVSSLDPLGLECGLRRNVRCLAPIFPVHPERFARSRYAPRVPALRSAAIWSRCPSTWTLTCTTPLETV